MWRRGQQGRRGDQRVRENHTSIHEEGSPQTCGVTGGNGVEEGWVRWDEVGNGGTALHAKNLCLLKVSKNRILSDY